ncbi:MAG: PDZ domain-containing protein, partial [Chitinophagia bacterium]|nr:PDZ domain-containing protein [Chitinophagia bacterium]
GISFLDPKSATPQQIQQLGLDKIDGVYIDNVVPNSGAAVAGLTHGDIIIAINGQKVNDKPHLQEQIAIYQPGDNITVTYKRNGTEYKATVKLTNINGTTDILKAEQPLKMLGASFKQMTQSEKESYNVKGGIIVTDPGNGTLARQTNMKKGFIILSINNQPVSTLADFSQLMASSSNLQIAGFQPGYDGMYYFELNNIDAQHDK